MGEKRQKAPRAYVILGPGPDGELIPISVHLDLEVALASQVSGTVIRTIAGGYLGAEVYRCISDEDVGEYVTCVIGEHKGVVGYYDDDIDDSCIAFYPGAFAGGYYTVRRSWVRLATASEVADHVRKNKQISECYDTLGHEAGSCACAMRDKEIH